VAKSALKHKRLVIGPKLEGATFAKMPKVANGSENGQQLTIDLKLFV
jgi:hypothetical protein